MGWCHSQQSRLSLSSATLPQAEPQAHEEDAIMEVNQQAQLRSPPGPGIRHPRADKSHPRRALSECLTHKLPDLVAWLLLSLPGMESFVPQQ